MSNMQQWYWLKMYKLNKCIALSTQIRDIPNLKKEIFI